MDQFDIEKDIERLYALSMRLADSASPSNRAMSMDLRDGLATVKSRLSSGLASRSDIALQAYESAPLGCALIDSKGVLTDVNARLAEMLGSPSVSLLARQFSDFVAPESRDIFFRRCVVLFSGLSPEAPCELKMLKTAGDRFFASIKGVPVSTSNGRMCLLFISDINAERTISMALAESERRFRLLFEQNPLGYLALNSAGCVSEVNEAASAMLGLPRESLVGRHMSSLAAPESIDTLNSLLAALRRNGHVRGQTEMEMLRGGSSSFIASVCGNVGVDSHGLFTQTHLIIADISAARKADSERRLLAAAIEHASESVLITNVDGVILYANKAFEDAVGSTRDTIVGSRFGSFIAEVQGQEGIYSRIAAQLAAGQPWGGRVSGRKSDGSLYEMELAVSAVKGADGSVVNHVAVSQDITARLRMECELRQSQKMQAIGTLAGGIAHDFNNILMAMMGYTEMAIETLGENQRAKVFLHQVLTSSRRARDLIKQILTFSRQTERSLRPLQAGLVLKEALKLLRSTLPSTIKMKSSIKSRSLCLADLTELHQVVMNLCTNASHAMSPGGGVLDVCLDECELDAAWTASRGGDMQPGRYIELTVSDTGVGIPPENLERIFEPFFTTKPAGEGTGMGLSVVHGIIKELNGHIEVKSELGLGSSFKIFIPVVEGVQHYDEEQSIQKFLGAGQTVLCVDDEPSLVELVGGILQTINYIPVMCGSPSEALAMIAKDPSAFDAVITDHTMPDMTGLQLSREILKIRPDLPVILCTGFSGAIMKGEAADSGVRDILFKPVSISDLGFALRKVLPVEQQTAAIAG